MEQDQPPPDSLNAAPDGRRSTSPRHGRATLTTHGSVSPHSRRSSTRSVSSRAQICSCNENRSRKCQESRQQQQSSNPTLRASSKQKTPKIVIGSADDDPSDGVYDSSDNKSSPFGIDMKELGSALGFDDAAGLQQMMSALPNVNTYQQKKNLAQGMMDLALLSANASQLRYVLESSATHPYFWSSVIFIGISIFAQVMVGVGLIVNSRYDVTDEKDIYKADQINNMTVLGIFLITFVNVFIASFCVTYLNNDGGTPNMLTLRNSSLDSLDDNITDIITNDIIENYANVTL